MGYHFTYGTNRTTLCIIPFAVTKRTRWQGSAMRSLIIHNSASGFGSTAIFEYEHDLLQGGDECVMRVLGATTPIAELLTDAEDFDLVTISGGDGTVTNALYALRNRNVPTCIFPSGTANLLFSNLGNAPEPTAIAKACHDLSVRALDLGELQATGPEASSEPLGFGIMSGMGFDAQIMGDAIAGKQALGEAAYFAAALNNLKPTVANFTISVDGQTHTRKGISCIVANTSQIQGDINILPGCRMDDGMIDVMVLASTDALQLLLPILAGIIDPLGEVLGRPRIERFRGADIKVTSSTPLPIERDGDIMEGLYTGYEARALPKSNLIVVDQHSPYYSDAQ